MLEAKHLSRKFVSLASAALLVACLGLAACGGGGSSASAAAYKDGTYTGTSSVMQDNVDGDGYAEVTITVKDGAIVDAQMQAYLPDGTPKDENYGKDGASYSLAQKIVATGDDYVAQLVEVGNVEDVDAVSGATYLYDQFAEAAADALAQAAA